MLFAGLSGRTNTSSHNRADSLDHDDPSTTQDPCTILSPCSLSSSSTKELASSSLAGSGLPCPPGASPRHGLDATNGGLPSVRGSVTPTQHNRSSRSNSSSISSKTRNARNLTLGVSVDDFEAVLRPPARQQQQQQQGGGRQGKDEDDDSRDEDDDCDSNSNSSSPCLPPSGRTPTFAFFKRSNSALATLVGMNNNVSHSASTTPSSHGVTADIIKKKRGFPHLILTPKGNSSHPSSILPPRALPPLTGSSTNGPKSGNSNKLVSSSTSLMSSLFRLRRRATISAEDEPCPSSLPPSDSSSSNSTATTTPKESNVSSKNRNRKLILEPGLRVCSSIGPPSLSTMDFQYDGSKILDYLYVGGEHIPSQDALAETFNITHIVNTTMKDYYPHHPFGQGDYCQLYLLDSLSEELTNEKLETAFAMVERARAGGHACLVHCRNGMSRSTSVVIAYLMKYYKMPLLEAFSFVRERRPCTSPNPSFMRQLARLEREWNGGGRNSLDVEHYADDRFACIRKLAVKEEEEEEEEEEERESERGKEGGGGGWR